MKKNNNGWKDAREDSANPFLEDEIPFYEPEYLETAQCAEIDPGLYCTPKSIFGYLDAHVYGHTEYKRQLAFFVWQLKNGHRPSALLIAGNSGEGKTETIRALKRIYPNIAVVDGASVTPQGYKGNNKLASAMNLLDFDDPINPPIYVIDEADKLICRRGWTDGDLTGELLKLMEDGVINISGNERESKYISTEDVGFILIGSFSYLTERTGSRPIGFSASADKASFRKRKSLSRDMIAEQLTPELMGRIGEIIILEPFEQTDFEKILKDKRYSPVSRFEREYDLHISLKPRKRREIAASAFENQTGVRSMTTEIARCLMDSLFEDPEVKEISI